MLGKHMITSAVLLAFFSVIGTGLVALTYENTKDDIAAAEREALLKKLHAVIDNAEHDNDLFTDVVMVQSEEYLGTSKPVAVFRARMKDEPVALLITPIAPNGYSGAIKLLVGIRYDGSVAGVRALTHKETPGLGDAIEERRSDWIYQFNNHSIDHPEKAGWKVRRDRGQFDQITGATITSRAVVKAVRNALEYYQSNRDFLFNEGFNKSDEAPEQQPTNNSGQITDGQQL
ncbi:electron transport complex subunit RsxG [Kaarinaea lacus]